MEPIDFKTIFPDFMEIEDESIRESGLRTWTMAAQEGGWNKAELLALPFVMTELVDCPVTLVEHVNGVSGTAKAIHRQLTESYGELLAADRDVVLAGALLHDVGKLVEYQKEGTGYRYSDRANLVRHPLSGALLASRCGVPDRVLHIIATHSFEGSQSHVTKESFIVRNADWINFNFLSLKYPSTMTHK